MAERSIRDWAWIGAVAVLQLLPIIAVALNSVATEWAGTILPAGYTDAYIQRMLGDPRFTQAIVNSLIIGFGSVLVTPLVCVPAILVAHCYLPRLDRSMAGLVILPYAVPTIVLALGLLRLYSGNYGIVLNGTPWVLIFGYLPLAASLYYIPIKSNLRALDLGEIFEAGRIVGASDFAIMRKIVLPCISQGLMVGLVMNFTLVISDFVYANLLVGGHFPTLQIFMAVLNGGSGRFISVLITAYFLVVLITTSIVMWVTARGNIA
jgi:putative spermidine/putrescine transport system permease protein